MIKAAVENPEMEEEVYRHQLIATHGFREREYQQVSSLDNVYREINNIIDTKYKSGKRFD
jgi:hypothetical protein